MTHILLIDDDGLDRMFMRSALQRAEPQIAVSECADPRQAVSTVESDEPDITLLDVRMPGLDGFAVLERLRTAPGGRDRKIILVSGSTNQQDVMRAHHGGATAYVVKPASITGYSDLAQRILTTWIQPEREN